MLNLAADLHAKLAVADLDLLSDLDLLKDLDSLEDSDSRGKLGDPAAAAAAAAKVMAARPCG